MSTTAYPSHPKPNRGIYTILKATMVAGSLDIIIALLNFYIKTQKHPVLVLQYITSAVFGKGAYSPGASMPLTGLLFHYIITFIWATIFFLIYPKIILVIKNSIVAGLLYAIIIWLAMNLVVLPLTLVPKSPFNLTQAVTGAVILMIAIGLPFGMTMKKYYQGRNSAIY